MTKVDLKPNQFIVTLENPDEDIIKIMNGEMPTSRGIMICVQNPHADKDMTEIDFERFHLVCHSLSGNSPRVATPFDPMFPSTQVIGEA